MLSEATETEFFELSMSRGMALARAGDAVEAAKLGRQALAVAPSHLGAQFLASRSDNAAHSANRSARKLTISARQSNEFRQISLLQAKAGNAMGAIESSRRAVCIDPTFSASYGEMAVHLAMPEQVRAMACAAMTRAHPRQHLTVMTKTILAATWEDWGKAEIERWSAVLMRCYSAYWASSNVEIFERSNVSAIILMNINDKWTKSIHDICQTVVGETTEPVYERLYRLVDKIRH